MVKEGTEDEEAMAAMAVKAVKDPMGLARGFSNWMAP
jgi:hypothetical protein